MNNSGPLPTGTKILFDDIVSNRIGTITVVDEAWGRTPLYGVKLEDGRSRQVSGYRIIRVLS